MFNNVRMFGDQLKGIEKNLQGFTNVHQIKIG